MFSHLVLLICIVLLCNTLSYASTPDFDKYWDPTDQPLQQLVKISFTSNVNQIPAAVWLSFVDYAVGDLLGDFNAPPVYSIATENILNGQYQPIDVYLTRDWNDTTDSSQSNYLVQGYFAVNITQQNITDSFNASLCANNELIYNLTYGDNLNATTNQFVVNDSANCYIDQPAFSYCNETIACPDGLVCVENFLQAWGGLYNDNSDGHAFWPAEWCMPANATEPISVIETQMQYGFSSFSLSIEDKLSYLTGQLDTFYSDAFLNITSLCANESISAIIVSVVDQLTIEDESEYEAIIVTQFIGPSNKCQGAIYPQVAGLVTGGAINIAPQCVETISLLPTPWMDTSSSGTISAVTNAQYNCGLALGQLAACQPSSQCANDDFRCWSFDVFQGFNASVSSPYVVCQNTTELQTNVYKFNFTIIPTSDNTSPTNFDTNFVELTQLLTTARTVLSENNCLFADSIVLDYIDQHAPYYTAALFVIHIEDSNSSCIDLDFTSSSSFMLSSSDSSLFTSTITVSSDQVFVNDCTDASGNILLGVDSCPLTAGTSVEDNVIVGCVSNSDCYTSQVCQSMSNGETACVVSIDDEDSTTNGSEINLVRYTVTVPKLPSTEITAALIAEAALTMQEQLTLNNCLNTSSTDLAISAPLKKPYNILNFYMTNVNITNNACLAITSSDLTALNAKITAVHLTDNLDPSCIVNSTIACTSDVCSQFIACDTGLYTSCESDENACSAYNASLYCNSDIGSDYAICLVSAATSTYSMIMPFVIMFMGTIILMVMNNNF